MFLASPIFLRLLASLCKSVSSLNLSMKRTSYVFSFHSVSILSSMLCIFFIVSFSLIWLPTEVSGFGSSSTIAVSYGSDTVCGILAGKSIQGIQCFREGEAFTVQPRVSYRALAGSENFFCALRSNGFDLYCWDTRFSNFSSRAQRIHHDSVIPLTDLSVGDDGVCALQAQTGILQCWPRGKSFGRSPLFLPEGKIAFQTITSGEGFSCGIVKDERNVLCWGESGIGDFIEGEFGSMSMLSLVAGKSHVCGIAISGVLICKGINNSGQLNVPSNSSFYFYELALGGTYTCALQRNNGSVLCWGNGGNVSAIVGPKIQRLSFVSIVAAIDFTCGLRSDDLTLKCWGPGWSGKSKFSSLLPTIIPGPCVRHPCRVCGTLPNSNSLCRGDTNICRSCVIGLPFQEIPGMGIHIKSSQADGPTASPMAVAPSLAFSISPPTPAKAEYRPLWAYEVFGAIGIFSGAFALCYFLYLRISRSKPEEKMQDFKEKELQSVASNGSSNNADTAFVASNASSAPQSRSSSITQLSSFTFRRDKSWDFSLKHVEKSEVFTLAELAVATRNFSPDYKIGRGSFGTVYKGKLADGREVAVKREEICIKKERENAFQSELTLLTRVHHKHLVGLVGFCEGNTERLLVYEYIENGALHDLLHNPLTNNSRLNSWKMRIKIALDAARGIEYLHNYAVPPIIHRDIKSSNILLDAKWVGRVSDFGLSLKGPENEQGSMSIKAVGTVGYIDPEYYVLKVLTTKSDVYGFGVVLLELLTGKKALFKESEGNGPTGVVEYAGPFIVAGEVWKVLDKRVEQPVMNESEAVELLAYTAMMCVNLEGKERPTMSDVVSNLERALVLCKGCSGAFSPNFYSFN